MADASVVKIKEKSFVWTDTLTKSFLELLCDYQRQNEQKNGFSWITLTESFEQKTGMKCNKDTLKNNHGNVKNQWKLWLKLKNGETGLGWDYENQRIAAPHDWWTRKMQENPEYRVFKRHGIPPDVEAMMEIIYGGIVAIGEHCIAPSMEAPIRTGVLEENEDFHISDNDLFPDDTTAPPSTALDTVPHDTLARGGIGGLDDVEIRTSGPTPSRDKGKRRGGTINKGVVKRNVRRSVGSGLYQEHLAASIRQSELMTSLWEHEVNSAAQSSNQPRNPAHDSMKIVREMINEGLLQDGSPLWCFATSLMSLEPKREIFMLIDTNQSRLEWLKWEFKERKGVDP